MGINQWQIVCDKINIKRNGDTITGKIVLFIRQYKVEACGFHVESRAALFRCARGCARVCVCEYCFRRPFCFGCET